MIWARPRYFSSEQRGQRRTIWVHSVLSGRGKAGPMPLGTNAQHIVDIALTDYDGRAWCYHPLPYGNVAGDNRRAVFSANLRDELERARVVGGGGAEGILQTPAKSIHATVVTSRGAARTARRSVRPRRAAVVRIGHYHRHACR